MPRLSGAGQAPYLSGDWARPWRPRKSLEAHPQALHWEEAEFSGFRENLSQFQPLLLSGQSLLWDGGVLGAALQEHHVGHHV